MTGLSPIKTDKENIKQVRFIPKSFGYICEIIHNESINYQEIKGDKILGIDIGLRNIMSLSSGIIVNGKHLISYNQYYNKFKAMYMSFVKDKGTSNKIKKLERNRYFFFENQFHKISKWLINYCLSNGYSAIVIGKNNYWKQNVNLGKVNNQKFVSIPFNKLLQKVEYKANQVGIKVVYDDESYTSKCDALAFEKIGKKENYLGHEPV